jgi:hypothetical protein
MDFNELIKSVGLWPAAVLALGYWVDRIRREQIADLRRRVTDLETEAREALKAKDSELSEMRRLVLERRGAAR